MKISLPNGIEAWFDVDDITIHVWGSSWTGREVVTVCQGERKEVISSKRSWRFKTPHAFEHKGHNYLVALGVGFGGAGVELYRDGVLIDSDQINTTGFRIDPATGKLDWKHALKSLALPLVVGLAVGMVIPPFLVGLRSRRYAAMASRCFGVIPPNGLPPISRTPPLGFRRQPFELYWADITDR